MAVGHPPSSSRSSKVIDLGANRKPIMLDAMAMKICDFQDKMSYNLACAGETSRMLALTRRFSESANLMVSVKYCSDDPCCHGNENFEILTENWP